MRFIVTKRSLLNTFNSDKKCRKFDYFKVNDLTI